MNSYFDFHPSRRDVLALLAAGGAASLAVPSFASTPRRGGRIKVVPAFLLKPVLVDKSNWQAVLVTSRYYKEEQFR